MIEIQLSNVPNQSFSITLDNNLYDIFLQQTNDAVGVTIARNNVTLISNVRATPGIGLLPYDYLENGNFFLVTNNDEIPDYTKFGITQTLIYASMAELAAIRAGT